MTITVCDEPLYSHAALRGAGSLAQRMRLAMAMAILSDVIHKIPSAQSAFANGEYHIVAAVIAIAFAAAMVGMERTSRSGLLLFGVAVAVFIVEKWYAYHNHGWLAVWAIPVAAAFGVRWWEDETYRWYLRVTLGVVMLGAAVQKLLAGTYLDGSLITYLSLHGSTTEQLFGFLCGSNLGRTCMAHSLLGGFLIAWQIVVGILLIAGLRSLWFLAIEVAFLLGAGLYADEMNFQALNITLLCMAFGFGISPRLACWIIILLGLDVINISTLVNHVL